MGALPGKRDFRDIYDRSDPRAYAAVLRRLDYRLPEEARAHLLRVAQAARASGPPGKLEILDLGCSYGINAALLGRGLSLDVLFGFWAELPSSLPAREVVRATRRFLARFPRTPGLAFTGLDVAGHAVAFALRAGLLDRGLRLDLEAAEPPPEARRLLASVDLVIGTGVTSYITPLTPARILATASGRPWFALTFARGVPVDPFAALFAEHGYVCERLEGPPLFQRRFADGAERRRVCERLRELGLDPEPERRRDALLARLWLFRPHEGAHLPVAGFRRVQP